MNDKELLEKAARAAGYEQRFDIDGFSFVVWEMDNGEAIEAGWNPLKSDEDAFRLMVDCRMSVSVFDEMALADYESQGVDCDHSAATRQVIVKAAAMMAEDLP